MSFVAPVGDSSGARVVGGCTQRRGLNWRHRQDADVRQLFAGPQESQRDDHVPDVRRQGQHWAGLGGSALARGARRLSGAACVQLLKLCSLTLPIGQQDRSPRPPTPTNARGIVAPHSRGNPMDPRKWPANRIGGCKQARKRWAASASDGPPSIRHLAKHARGGVGGPGFEQLQVVLVVR